MPGIAGVILNEVTTKDTSGRRSALLPESIRHYPWYARTHRAGPRFACGYMDAQPVGEQGKAVLAEDGRFRLGQEGKKRYDR